MSRTNENAVQPSDRKSIQRRTFLSRTGISGVAFAVMKASSVYGSKANSKVKLGLVGCGGRGTWITNLFVKHGGFEISAVSDYFQDRVERYGERFNVPAANRFTGLSGDKRMLDKGIVDAIAIESPPYFHPSQAQAGVEAGLHVYLAKPIAVDIPGCKTVLESGRKARDKNRCFLIDFQTRADPYYIEALQRVHDGAIGSYAFGESSYHAGCPWTRQFQYLEDDPHNPENRLRAWGLDKVLSGDIITEQNIHTLDVASWVMGQEPIQASGTCGRKVRKDLGNCNDYFTVVFEYPDEVGISFSSRQFEGHGSAGGINNRMFGTEGVLETSYGGNVLIRGENAYPGGKSPGIFTDGAAENIATFYKNITERNYENTTVEPSVRSNLVTILGRTAAYRKGIATWKEIMEQNEKLEFNLKGLKD